MRAAALAMFAAFCGTLIGLTWWGFHRARKLLEANDPWEAHDDD